MILPLTPFYDHDEGQQATQLWSPWHGNRHCRHLGHQQKVELIHVRQTNRCSRCDSCSDDHRGCHRCVSTGHAAMPAPQTTLCVPPPACMAMDTTRTRTHSAPAYHLSGVARVPVHMRGAMIESAMITCIHTSAVYSVCAIVQVCVRARPIILIYCDFYFCPHVKMFRPVRGSKGWL